MPRSIRAYADSRAGIDHDAHATAFCVDDDLGLYGVASSVGVPVAQLAASELHGSFARWFADQRSPRLAVEMAHEGLVYAFSIAADAVHRAVRQRESPGQASVTFAFVGAGRLLAVSVGDSRALLLRDGEGHVLTRVDTIADELLLSGELGPADIADHPGVFSLTRSLGPAPTTEYDLIGLELRPGDAVALATGGAAVYGYRLDELARVASTATLEALNSHILEDAGHRGAAAVTVRVVPRAGVP